MSISFPASFSIVPSFCVLTSASLSTLSSKLMDSVNATYFSIQNESNISLPLLPDEDCKGKESLAAIPTWLTVTGATIGATIIGVTCLCAIVYIRRKKLYCTPHSSFQFQIVTQKEEPHVLEIY